MSKQSNAVRIVSNNPAPVAAKPTKGKGKPANKKDPLAFDHGIIDRIVGGLVAIHETESIRDRLIDDIAKFREYKVKLGKSRRTCSICDNLHVAMTAAGLAKSTADNYLSALRAAINDGTPLILNAARRKAYVTSKSKDADGKPKKKSKNASKTTWATSGEVLDALAKAIDSVRNAAESKLWVSAMKAAPAGFEAALMDFLDAQGTDDE